MPQLPPFYILANGFYGLHAFLLALILAWGLMQPFDFFYGTWHDVQIKEGIEKFGPQNRYKQGFQDTTRAQRLMLFHEINTAVHNGGEGLDRIRYQTPSSGGQQRLLRKPEIVHLQDVANLLSTLFPFVVFIVFTFPVTVFMYQKTYRRLPELKLQCLGLLCVLSVLGGILLLIGAEDVFNTLHIWVFPKNHQWFFYYQESLMSTMMYAPRLFGWIAGAWVFISAVLFLAVHWTAHFALSRGVSEKPSVEK